MTHIQFLTLMYPSRLEAQLIFIFLGPLSIIAALTQFAPLYPHLPFVFAASATRNVCNATLSILFTISLLIWGFIVHRKQAWRTDGGTAAFGVGATLLAVISTALTIAYIPSHDQFEWVPGLTGAIVLWQSFLGWWWWVGAGMGITEIDEWLYRAEKRRKRRAAREARKKQQKGRLRGAWSAVTGRSRAASTAMENAPSGTTAMSRVNGSDSDSLHESTRSGSASTIEGRGRSVISNNSEDRWFWPLSLVRSTFRYVRNAHVSAARTRAIERAEHIRDVFGVEGTSPAEVSSAPSRWGPSSFEARGREGSQGALGMDGVERLVRQGREAEAEQDEEEGEEVEEARTKGRRTDSPHRPPEPPAALPSSSSMWWWGPLRRWRLQDTTEYSER
jgi:hypothetical protein